METNEPTGQPPEDNTPPVTDDTAPLGDGTSFMDDPNPSPTPDPNAPPAPKVAERPEYLSEAHWDAEKGEPRTEALAKSFKDTKAALDKKKDESGIPEHAQQYLQVQEDGNLFVPEELTHLPPLAANDVVLTSVLDAAMASGVSTEQMNALTKAWMEGQNTHMSQFVFDEAAERAKVDADPVRSKHTIDGVKVYMSQLDLNEGEKSTLHALLSSGEGINLLNKTMALAGHNSIPMGATVTPTADTTALMAEWNALRQDPASRDRDKMKQDRFELLGSQLHG